MVPGDGGEEEGGVKVNLFKKKKFCRVKGGRGGHFHKKYTNIHYIYFQSASVIYCLGFR